MYAIISGGALVSLCDYPRYVRRNEGGIYVEAPPEEAIALSVNGDLYNINGGDAIPDAPEAIVREDSAAEYVFQNREMIGKTGGQNAANIDYLSMMTGIDLPSGAEEGGADDGTQ